MDAWLVAIAAAAVLATLALAVLWRRQVRALQDAARQAEARGERIEDQLTDAERRLAGHRTMVQAASEILLVVDQELRMLGVNPAAVERFGEAPAGAKLITYTRQLELEQLTRDVLGMRTESDLIRVIDLDGRPYRARAFHAQDGVGIALSDVAEVQRLSRARQDMVANLSHELRTPLAALRLLAETLNTPGGRTPEMVPQLTGKMVSEIDTLHQMVQEMLDLSALESGRQAVRLQAVPLLEIAEKARGVLAGQAERKGVRLILDVDPQLRVMADAEQAPRAVINVLHNAVKFSPPGGAVNLQATPTQDGEWTVLSIADQGPGISPAALSRVFERFYREDRARGTPGTGLGLAIAQHILLAHGGRIWAENRHPPAAGAILSLAFQPA